MVYIEDRIDTLEQDFDTMWTKLYEIENQLNDYHINDRVSTLEDIVENDGEKLDMLGDRFCKLHEEVTGKPATMPIQMPTQVQQTTEEFVKIVRCKDCKWYVNDIGVYDTCKNEDGMFRPIGEDYCSRGEKI